MRDSHAYRVAIVAALLIVLAAPFKAFARDAPETSLLREGRVYEAAQLLQRMAKDEAAQKRAADLYFQLALYDKGLERLVASGMSKASAASTAVAEAFSQGNRASALRIAEANGLSTQAKAEYSRRELAEGRARAALVLARESGDEALVEMAGKAAYEESVESGPAIVGYLSAAPRRLRFSQDGRFIALYNDDKSEIEVLDTRLRADRPASERGRIVAKSMLVGSLAINEDGRFLALVGFPKEKPGRDNLSLRMERLDTGFVVNSMTLSGRFPKGQASALAFAGDLLCVAVGKSLVLFDPWSGDVKASTSVAESVSSIEYLQEKEIFACWFSNSGKYRVFDASNLQVSKQELSITEKKSEQYGLAGDGLLYEKASGVSLYVPASSAEELRVEVPQDHNAWKTGPLSRPLVGSHDQIDFSGGVDAALSPDGSTLAILAREGVVLAPFPFLDREETAAKLAKEFGATEQFAPLCGHFVDEGRLDEAKRLWTLAGVEGKTISRMFAESKLRLGAPLEAAAFFLEAGDNDRALSVAEGLVATASGAVEVASAFSAGQAIFEKAGSPLSRLAAVAGRSAEKFGDFPAALDYYSIAGSKGDIERLAFDPKLASVDWCLSAGRKLGLGEAEIYARAADLLEQQKKWGDAARARLWLRDDEGLGRVAKVALAGSAWDHVLLDALKSRADPGLCRAAADQLMSKGELVYAVEQYAAINDLSGVARVADKALDADDFVFAAELYKALGTKSVKATTAVRLALVFDEMNGVMKDAGGYLAQETIDGVNTGRLAVQWPISGAKADDAAYQQMKKLGDALLAMPSKPRSAEAKRCAAYLSKEAIKGSQAGGPDQANSLMSRATQYTFAARLLTAMGR